MACSSCGPAASSAPMPPPWRNLKVVTSAIAGTLLAMGFFGAMAGLPTPVATGLYIAAVVIGGYFFGREALAELVSAYVPFANGGRGAIAHGVKRIRTIEGEVLYERAGSGLGRLISAENAGAMNRMLSEAVRSGTGRSSALANRPSAGKTGTTQESKDAWFVGYTRQIVAGVWLGSDEGLPMSKDVTGGTLPTLIWKYFMERATAGQQVLALPGTDVVDQAQADTKNFDDVLAGVLKEPALPAQNN